MPKYVILNPAHTVNGVDLSDHASKATLEIKFESPEVTSFGDAFKVFLKGLGEAKLTVDYWQDFASGEVDATLWPIVIAYSTIAVTLKPTNAAISATNPEYGLAEAHLLGYVPMDGKVGDASATTCEFVNAGSGGVVRDVTP